MTPFHERLLLAAGLVEGRLAGLIAEKAAQCTPPRLLSAMENALLSGGKRFRPFLMLESAGLLGLASRSACDAAAALECIHCYSLVHDDLPCMDNDLVRRGQPSIWKAYDEWTAVLAGDALQTMAFETLSAPRCHADANVRCELIRLLARAAGSEGMVGGQALDLEAERLKPDWTSDVTHVARLQQMKTGRLIVAATEMGAVLGGAGAVERNALRTYGTLLGYAFQISDDILDAEGGAEAAGKATGKDAAAGKATLVAALGIVAARAKLEETIAAAVEALAPFGSQATLLADAARFMRDRRS